MSRIEGGFACGGAQNGFLTDADRAGEDICCWGSLQDGPTRCTCWEPTYDVEQASPILGLPVATRATRCHDCAFRPDSPERARGDELEELGNFHCHQGVRRVTSWRHPDNRVRTGASANVHRRAVGFEALTGNHRRLVVRRVWAQAQRRTMRELVTAGGPDA